jgi:hypothetical protein
MAKRETPLADRPRFVLYFRGHLPPDVDTRTWVPIFWDPARAKAVLMKFLGSDEHELERKNVIRLVGTSFTIFSEQLDDIMDADHTGIELTTEEARLPLRFKLGSWEEDHSKDEPPADEQGGDEPKAKPKAEAKPKRARKPDNFVTIGELCKQWKIKPFDARTALRASDLEKPEFGWAFDPKDIPTIKKLCGVK